MFKVICGECGNEISLKDKEDSTEKEIIQITETRSKYYIKIKCECGNEIWISFCF